MVGSLDDAPPELLANIRDPNWRLSNLYYILDKNGQTVLFTPNEVQQKFYNDIWYRNVIPKARQRGFSTAVQLLMLDACLFNDNIGAGIIAQDEDTAKGIRNNKIKFAYDRLPSLVKRPLVTDNVTELVWNNGSFMLVALSTRGRTLNYLHISEYGKICASAPDKAKEIQSGSLPSVDQSGIIVIESTAEGTEGDFYDKTQRAKAFADAGKTLSKLDYKLHFASWWDADEYELDPELVTISSKDIAYFDRMKGLIGREIGPRKRAWYVAKRDSDFGGDNEMMWSQYPTTIDEAFMVSVEGTYLADQLALARRQGRVGEFPWDPSLPVNTFWDIGYGHDNTVVWYHQRVGVRDHWIDYDEDAGEPPSHMVRKMQDKPYVYGKHYLPHDAEKNLPDAEVLRTYADMLTSLGLKNLEIVPRIAEVIIGINQLREDFSFYCFDETKCAEGLKHLAGYRKDWNKRTGTWMQQPRRNGHQHAADAIRQKAQVAPEIRMGSGQRRPRRANRSGMVV